MNILFLGIVFNKEEEKEYLNLSKVGLQGASNLFQLNIIKGLTENTQKENLSVLSVLPVGTYPLKYKKILLESKEWVYNDTQFQEIGSINISLLKQINRYFAIRKKIEEWINKSIKNRHIIIYSLYPVFISAIKRVKEKYPEVKITVIVPDLPSIYGLLSKNPIKAQIQKKIGNRVLKELEVADYFVLLTESMKKPLKIGNKPNVIIEGLVTDEVLPKNNNLESDTFLKSILYTGSLNTEFGIEMLLDAFQRIDDSNVELWICGSGETESKIKEKAKVNRRIKFFGYVSNEKARALQNKATILINPRKNDATYTKYSFPSKTMEYIASGKPVIMYKLDGIPNEYDEHLYYVDSDSVEDLKDKIIEVLNKSPEELKQNGLISQKWLIENKNIKSQVKKITDMILN